MPSTSVISLALLTIGTAVSAAVIGVMPTFVAPSRSVLVGRQGFETAWTRSIAGRQDTETIIGATRTVLEPAPATAPAHPHWPPYSPPHKPSVDTSDVFVTTTAGTLTLIERQQDTETILGASRTEILPVTTTKVTTKTTSLPTSKPTTQKVDTSDIFSTRTLSLLTLAERQDIETIIGATRTQLLPVPTTDKITSATPPSSTHKPTTQTVDTSDVFVTRTAGTLTLIERNKPTYNPTTQKVDTSDVFVTRTAGTLTLVERNQPTHKPTTQKVDTSDIFVTRTAGTLTLIERQQNTETILGASRTEILPAPTTSTKATVTTPAPPKPTIKVDTSDILVTRTASALSLTIW